jgi:hypothetical protein
LAGLDGCGLYSWWIDSSGAKGLTHGIEAEVAEGLVYAGQTGATKWPSGRRSRATLASRIGANHIRGRVRGSTFRLTLAAALHRELDFQIVGSKKLAPESEHRLTDWIRDHLAVSVFPYGDPDELGRVEDDLLDKLDPPLNLTGRPRTRLRANLTALRAVVAAGVRSDL